jgi:hypothetical protein
MLRRFNKLTYLYRGHQTQILSVYAYLKEITNISLDQASFFITSTFIGYLIGTTITGAIYERVNPFLSAFRSGHGCQTVLLKIIEDWKKALDDNKCMAAILMDLSKAFELVQLLTGLEKWMYLLIY